MSNVSSLRAEILSSVLGRTFYIVLIDRTYDETTRTAEASVTTHKIRGRLIGDTLKIDKGTILRLSTERVIRVTESEISNLPRDISTADRLVESIEGLTNEAIATAGHAIHAIRTRDGYRDLVLS